MIYKINIKSEKIVSKKQNGFYIFSTCILILFGLSSAHAFLSENPTLIIDKSLEHIIPIKINVFSLDAEELFYEPMKHRNVHNNNYKKDPVRVRHNITSTYRHKSNLIWDPYPEYIINAFDRQLHLVLHQDSSFIPSELFRVTKILENNQEEDIPSETTFFGCYYNGYIKGDKQSAVAVSLCHGMTGYIKTNFGYLFIQPISEATDYESSHKTSTTSKKLHKIWQHSKLNDNSHVDSTDSNEINTNIILNNNYFPTLKRMKRELQQKSLTIELLIVVDNTMVDFHKEDLESYIMTLISVVSKLFDDPSLGKPIRISVANIIAVNKNKEHLLEIYPTSSKTLNEFCLRIQKTKFYYDAALFLTRRAICESPCKDIGIARMGSICNSSACTAVQDRGLATSFTIAYELGHILNIPHDNEDECKEFTKSDNKGHIMFSRSNEDPWSWSTCSRHYVSEFLKRGQSCLKDKPTTFRQNKNTRFPGEIYSQDRQCELMHGNESQKICFIGQDCQKLWCKLGDTVNCRTFLSPWADGTPCNIKKTDNKYWCQSGKCLPR